MDDQRRIITTDRAGSIWAGITWCSLLLFIVAGIIGMMAQTMRVKGQNVCLARRVAGVRFGLFECRLSGCSRCR